MGSRYVEALFPEGGAGGARGGGGDAVSEAVIGHANRDLGIPNIRDPDPAAFGAGASTVNVVAGPVAVGGGGSPARSMLAAATATASNLANAVSTR